MRFLRNAKPLYIPQLIVILVVTVMVLAGAPSTVTMLVSQVGTGLGLMFSAGWLLLVSRKRRAR